MVDDFCNYNCLFVMKNFNYFLGLMKHFRNQREVKDIPQLTEYLKNNQSFKRASLRVNEMKQKIIAKMDEEAFGKELREKIKKISKNNDK